MPYANHQYPFNLMWLDCTLDLRSPETWDVAGAIIVRLERKSSKDLSPVALRKELESLDQDMHECLYDGERNDDKLVENILFFLDRMYPALRIASTVRKCLWSHNSLQLNIWFWKIFPALDGARGTVSALYKVGCGIARVITNSESYLIRNNFDRCIKSGQLFRLKLMTSWG